MNREMLEMLDLVLVYLYDRIPHGISKAMILEEVFEGDTSVPIDAIMLYMEKESHIHLTPSASVRYSVTIPGMEFMRTASIPHKPYQCRENRRSQDLRDMQVTAKLAKKADWPKQNWLALLLITFFLGIVSTLSAEFLKKRLFPDSPTTLPMPILRDTIRPTQMAQP
jgi:hypothetical protein